MSQTFTQMLGKVKEFHDKHNFASKENNGHDMPYRILLTMEELGELAECFTKGKSNEEKAEELAIKPIAKIISYADASQEPKWFTTTPTKALENVIKKAKLEKNDIDKIIDIELDKLLNRIDELGYKLKLSKKAKSFIAEKGFDKQYGARPLKRAIQKYVEDLIAEEIIKSNIQSGDTISIDLNKETDSLFVKLTAVTTTAGKSKKKN